MNEPVVWPSNACAGTLGAARSLAPAIPQIENVSLYEHSELVGIEQRLTEFAYVCV